MPLSKGAKTSPARAVEIGRSQWRRRHEDGFPFASSAEHDGVVEQTSDVCLARTDRSRSPCPDAAWPGQGCSTSLRSAEVGARAQGFRIRRSAAPARAAGRPAAVQVRYVRLPAVSTRRRVAPSWPPRPVPRSPGHSCAGGRARHRPAFFSHRQARTPQSRQAPRPHQHPRRLPPPLGASACCHRRWWRHRFRLGPYWLPASPRHQPGCGTLVASAGVEGGDWGLLPGGSPTG